MQNDRPSLFTRPDTFFGVCEAIGEDLHFNANILRLILALAIFWSPVAVFGVYAVLGLVVLASRKLYPNPRAATPAEREAAIAASVNDEPLPLAA